MYAKKRNSLSLFLICGIAAIPILLGTPGARATEKLTFKIEKEEKKAAESQKKPVEEKYVPEAMEHKEKDQYFYNPINKIDPFKSFISVRIEISQLAVSAIVLGSKGNWALVRDSKGDGHVIKVGTFIGRKNGRVEKILDKEIIVTESYKDIRGREITKNISMKLPSHVLSNGHEKRKYYLFIDNILLTLSYRQLRPKT